MKLCTVLIIFSFLREAQSKIQNEHDKELRHIKYRVEKEKEEIKDQFKAYCEEIKVIYDQEKQKLKNKLEEYSIIRKSLF